MRVLFVLFVSAGIASAWPQQQQAAPPAAVFQAPQQTIRVQVPPPNVQFEFAAPAPRAACAPAASFAAPAYWVPARSFAAPAVFAAPSPRIDVQTGLFGRVRRVIVN